tara:strand:+ start:33498 stop:35054 length:1557 start_codon:yes stop_codon:yes gene_type:complete
MATTDGIGEKTLATTYQKLLHTGGNNGVEECNPILTSAGSNKHISALWLGLLNGSEQRVAAKAAASTQTFFSLEDTGTDLAEGDVIFKAGGGGLNTSGRGMVTLKKEFHITGTQSSSTPSYDVYDGGLILFKGSAVNHSIYNYDNKTIFDNGIDMHGAPSGTFRFADDLEVGSISLDGTNNQITLGSLNTGDINTTDNFTLNSGAGQVAFIEAVEDLTIAASGDTLGIVLGTSGGKKTQSISIEAKDSTASIVKINSESQAGVGGNPVIEIGVDNTASSDYYGTQLVQIGDYSATLSENTHNNTSIGELALKSPKTKFWTGALWFDAKAYDATGVTTFPSFYCGAPSTGEGVLSVSLQDGTDSTHTVQSKLDNSLRDLLLYTDGQSTTYEVHKSDISKGRLDYFHPRTDSVSMPGIAGSAYTYVKEEKFNVLANEGTVGAFYLDLNAGSGYGTALNTIQEAAPAAVTSVQTSSGTGAHTDAEYNALQDDIVNLRATLDGLIDELKEFRLWKENSGVEI